MDEEIKCCKFCNHFNRAVDHCNENDIDIKQPYFEWCFSYESVNEKADCIKTQPARCDTPLAN